MKVAIIYAGHFGSTKQAAEILQSKLKMESELFDANAGIPESDIKDFDTVIFGTNVRMLLLNKHFRKLAKQLKNSLQYKTVYGYIIGIESNRAEQYIKAFMRRLPQTKHVVFAGGMLSNAGKGFSKNIIDSVAESYHKQGKEMPRLFEDKLTELANIINNPPML